MAVYLVNRADNFHSLVSFDVLGIADSFKNAVKIIKKQAKEEGIKLSSYDKLNLLKINQTQGSKFDGEFNIKEINLNELI